MNYFATKIAAERYSKGRPDFHSNNIKHIREYLHIQNKCETALDIACGTGLSTKALLELATNVYGTDSSQEMLDLALNKKEIHYSIANAVAQPFLDTYFNLITVCSGVHWFPIDAFLIEAHRLLKSKSCLVLYDNFFIAEMDNKPEFKNWYNQAYLKKFPAPPRNDHYSWTPENLIKKKFKSLGEELFTNPVYFKKKELLLYFTTQSNSVFAIKQNKISYSEIEDWLDKELSVFFNGTETKQLINFGNWIKYLQKIN